MRRPKPTSMAQPEKPYSWDIGARLEPHPGISGYQIIILPQAVIDELPAKGRVRVKGLLHGQAFSLAVHSLGQGDKYLMVGNALRRAAKIREGMLFRVCFDLADPDELILPVEFEEVLDAEPEFKKVWESFTPGRRRGLCHYVSSAKASETRIKRSIECMKKALRGELYFQRTRS